MADEFQLGSGNWWDTTRSSTPAPSSTLSSMGSYGSSHGWQTDIMDIKTRSTMDQSASVSGNSIVFTDPQKLQEPHDESSGGGFLADPSLQMMGLGLSSHNMDWNPPLFRGEKAEGGYRTYIQEGTSTNFQQDEQWRQKLFGGSPSDDSSSINEYKHINRGRLSLDQPQYSSHGSSSDSPITCQGLNTNFQVDPSHVLQGFLVSENQQQQQQSNSDSRQMDYGYTSSYGMQNPHASNQLMPSWTKYPQFHRAPPPPPKQPPHGQLHFSNNTPFWNASSTTTVNDSRSSFFPPLQTPVRPPNFQEKAKTTSEGRDSVGTAKKNSSEASSKRARQETTTQAMPAFKVRKEKMGDRITALQQLVAPFGKTDTASVLSEAIDYIKFLHDQVSVLSTPYMKSGVAVHHQQDPEGPRQDLRSRGLCLVPVSSTFPVTHETTVDYWTPTFGGTFR